MLHSALEPALIRFPRISDPRGNLSFVQNDGLLPFDISRVLWINDVPGGSGRYGRALRSQWEALVLLSGAVSVNTISDAGSFSFTLDRPDKALVIPPLTWRSIDHFTTNSVLMVLCSDSYDEAGYIRDFNLFNEMLNERR